MSGIAGLTVLLVAAAAGFGIAHRFRLPAIPLLIAVGVVVGRFATLPEGYLENALFLGVTVLVFVAGMELSPGRVRGERDAAMRVGIAQFLLLGGVGGGTALLLGYSLETAAYLALALTASSTLVVVRLLQTRRQLFEPFGRLVLGVLLLQDLLVILAIPIVTRLEEGLPAVGRGLLATLFLVALAGVFLRWISPLIARRLGEDEEILLLVALGTLFAFLGLAEFFRLPFVAGAFLAGLSLSGFPTGALARGNLGSISDFFGALFFTALGAFLPIPGGAALLHALLFTGIVLVATPPIVALLAERAGFSARPAIAAGLLLAQTSEFSLVVGLQGVVLGQLDPEVFGAIALITVLTMTLTPLLATDRVTWALVRRHPFRRPIEAEEGSEGHLLLLGAGRNGSELLEVLLMTGTRILVVDDDPALLVRIREAEIPVLRGDVSDAEVLRAAGVERARAIVSTIRRRDDNAPLLALAEGIPILVRSFEIEDAEWIRSRGGRPILYSEAAARDFAQWYSDEWEGRNSDAPSL